MRGGPLDAALVYRSGQLPSRMVPGSTGRSAWCHSTRWSTGRSDRRVCAAARAFRSLEAEVDELRRRLDAIERHSARLL